MNYIYIYIYIYIFVLNLYYRILWVHLWQIV